jgi:hypothetical protein
MIDKIKESNPEPKYAKPEAFFDYRSNPVNPVNPVY